jgi:hypothetical protein
VLTALRQAWVWLIDEHVVGASPEVQRHFLRCDGCGRLFFHFWGCKEPGEGGRVGCPCGSVTSRLTRIPEWRAALLLGACYVWRRVIRGRRFWDPRMPSRRAHVDA